MGAEPLALDNSRLDDSTVLSMEALSEILSGKSAVDRAIRMPRSTANVAYKTTY